MESRKELELVCSGGGTILLLLRQELDLEGGPCRTPE